MNGASSQQTYSDANGKNVTNLPQKTLDFAGKVFNLARHGGDELLGAYLQAGLPANLTNDKGECTLSAHSRVLSYNIRMFMKEIRFSCSRHIMDIHRQCDFYIARELIPTD